MSFNVGVCLYGQVRNIEIINEYFENWRDPNNQFNFDFFISTWNDFDTNLLHKEFKKIKLTDISQVESKFRNLTYQVTEPGLKQYHVPIYVSYHIKNVVENLEEYETEAKKVYDIVILTRPDLHINFNDTVKYLKQFIEGNLHKLQAPVCSLNFDGIELDRGSVKISQDSLFIENRIGAKKHSELFSFIFEKKKYVELPLRYINGAHNTHAIGFIYNSFQIFINRIQTKLWRSTEK